MKTWKRRLWIARRILERRFFRIFSGFNRSFQPLTKYGIKAGYHHAAKTLDFDDTPNRDEWQKEVYLLAASIVKRQHYSSIIDLGCGSAFKLIEYLGYCCTTGIETDPTFDWLQKKYPDRHWLRFEETDPEQLEADLVICADVIEHLEDPDRLMRFIQSIKAHHIILSTPERDKKWGMKDYGPPENPFHYREWNKIEFEKYVSGWFLIDDQCIFNDRSITQVVICKK